MWLTWGRGEVHAGFQWENMRERDRSESLGVVKRVILKRILNK